MWIFRRMESADSFAVFAMMRRLFDSKPGMSSISDDVLWVNIANALGNSPYVEGWVCEQQGELLAYALCSIGYDSRHAALYVRLEDLYVSPDARRLPVGTDFLSQLPALYPDCTAVSLELPARCDTAVYRRCGYTRADQLLWASVPAR